MNVLVRDIEVRDGQSGARFRVHTAESTLTCGALVVATGGPSIPKLGATAFGYELAERMGHNVVERRPALVPLVLSERDQARWCDLTGLSAEVVASVVPAEAGRGRGGKREATPPFREKMLITHRGVSGPAVLQISSYLRPGQRVRFDLAPGNGAVLDPVRARRDRGTMLQTLRTLLPGRFAERWLQSAESQNTGLQSSGAAGLDFSDAGLQRAEAALHAWELAPVGTEGYAKAEVTAGGVDTRELDGNTMESRRVPGMYFIGEVVDVTGWLGGYNFQWAWASAAAAGRAL